MLTVVIVNYRTPDLTLNCLESLAAEVPHVPGTRVVVADSGSGDGSCERIELAIRDRGWKNWAQLLPLAENRGFASANNAVLVRELQRPEVRAFLLLNSDTIVRPGALAELWSACEQRPDAGLIGPRLEAVDGSPRASCFRNVSPLTEFLAAAATRPISRLLGNREVALAPADHPLEPDWISFACVLLRREVVERVGPLDCEFFMYYEDVEYCRRARDSGWNILYWPAAHVVHLEGGSAQRAETQAPTGRRPKYYYASRARYLALCYGRSGLWTANLLWMAGRAVSKAREVLGHKRPHTCAKEPWDIWTACLNPCRTKPSSG